MRGRGTHLRIVDERTTPTRVPRLWSARSLADRWHISRTLVYKLHSLGRLTGIRLFGVLRFREEDVLDLLRREGINVDGDHGA